MTSLSDFIQVDSPLPITNISSKSTKLVDASTEHSVKVGDTCLNWPLARNRAIETREKYDYKNPVEISSNGTEDVPANEWEVRREIR